MITNTVDLGWQCFYGSALMAGRLWRKAESFSPVAPWALCLPIQNSQFADTHLCWAYWCTRSALTWVHESVGLQPPTGLAGSFIGSYTSVIQPIKTLLILMMPPLWMLCRHLRAVAEYRSAVANRSTIREHTDLASDAKLTALSNIPCEHQEIEQENIRV